MAKKSRRLKVCATLARKSSQAEGLRHRSLDREAEAGVEFAAAEGCDAEGAAIEILFEPAALER